MAGKTDTGKKEESKKKESRKEETKGKKRQKKPNLEMKRQWQKSQKLQLLQWRQP
jgi:hypothetical protein